jgi:hypothetical protein
VHHVNDEDDQVNNLRPANNRTDERGVARAVDERQLDCIVLASLARILLSQPLGHWHHERREALQLRQKRLSDVSVESGTRAYYCTYQVQCDPSFS